MNNNSFSKNNNNTTYKTEEIWPQRKIKSNFFITLEKENPKTCGYDTTSDTYDSYHFMETDVCRDSTDLESNSSYTTDGIATLDVVEYEVASSSEMADFYSNDSSSGTDDIFLAVAAQAAAAIHCGSATFWSSDFADTEDSNNSTDKSVMDPELSSDDYWKCIKCNNKKNNPMFRYCEKCYQIRKTHFPPRPRHRRNRSELKRKVSSPIGSFGTSVNAQQKLYSPQPNKFNAKDNIEYKDNIVGSLNNSRLSQNGKFEKNNKNNILTSSYKKRRLSFANNNKSALNSAAESSTSEDHIISNNMSDNSSDEENIVKRSISAPSSNNFFSTPKFKNLKRKNPFQLSLANNAKRIFVNNSSCSTVNLTNNSSSNNSSIIKRDNNLISDSETDLALELIGNYNSQKDSGISSAPSSQEITLPGSILNLNEQHNFSDKNNKSETINISTNITSKILKENDGDSSDTVCDELDEKEFESSDESENKIIESQKSEILERPNTAAIIAKNCATPKSPTSNIITRHMSEFPISYLTGGDFSPTTRAGSIPRSVSTCSDAYTNNSLNTSPSVMKKCGQKNNFESNSNNGSGSDSKNDSCIVCYNEPKNGVFVHSKFLHLCCCYKCAVKIWNKNKKCPICNCAVKNVMKLFVH